jgi:hypothetical protein
MTGRSRAGPRRGASISRPAAVIFHARVEPAAARTRPWRSSRTSAAVTRSGRPCHGAGADVGDAAGADGIAVALVLGVSEGGEDDALLGGHDRPEASPARGHSQQRRASLPVVCSPARRAWNPNPPGGGGPMLNGHARRCCRSPVRSAILEGDLASGARLLTRFGERRRYVRAGARRLRCRGSLDWLAG